MSEQPFFQQVIEQAGKDASNRAMQQIVEGIAKATAIDAHDISKIVTSATTDWVRANLTPVIHAELDARREEILAAIREAIARIGTTTADAVVKRVEERLRGGQYGRGEAEGLVKALFGL